MNEPDRDEEAAIAAMITRNGQAFDDLTAFDRGEPIGRESAMTWLRMLPTMALVSSDSAMVTMLRQLADSWPVEDPQ